MYLLVCGQTLQWPAPMAKAGAGGFGHYPVTGGSTMTATGIR